MNPTRISRRRRVKQRGPVWLFDLDNTLHHASHEIFPAINKAMTQYIIDTLNVDLDEANRLRVGSTVR
jgi:FMN phosphatase YigB (HAD superfamily)